MEFYFSSLADFVWMDGHGPYVWACYIVTLAVFIFLALAPSMRLGKLVKQQKALAARSQVAEEVVGHEPG